MPFSTFLKKATNLIGLGSSPDTLKPPAIDGEIVYCKNNVCVHPPSARGDNHYSRSVPGYLTVKCQTDEFIGSTLILTWIPNDNLKQNPRSVENSPIASHHGTPRSLRRKQEYTKKEWEPSQSENGSPRSSLISSSSSNGDFSSHQGKSTFYVKDSGQKSGDNLKDCTSIKSDSGFEHDAESLDKRSVSTDFASPDSAKLFSVSEDIVSPDSAKDSVSSSTNSLSVGHQRSMNQKDGEITHCQRSISVEMEGDKLVITTKEFPTSKSEGSLMTAERFMNEKVINSESMKKDEYSEKNLDLKEQNGVSAPLNKSSNSKQQNGIAQETIGLSLDLCEVLVEDSCSPPEICVSQPQFEIDQESSGSTSGPDSQPTSPITPITLMSLASTPGDITNRSALMRGNPEAVALTHNLLFPDGTEETDSLDKCHSQLNCGVFSVDLSQMRSLRLFYSDESCSSGQLVIASRESQYKILHFHHGGLNKLADILQEWDFFKSPQNKDSENFSCHHFSVVRPELANEDCHPEEGVYDSLSHATWKQHMDKDGRIKDDFQLKKAIFFGGLQPSLRPEAWPFLLQYYPFDSTFEERERMRNDKFIEYQNIRQIRENMCEEEKEMFWRSVQCTVEKDVVRTDRSNPYYKGENNPNIEILKNILLNYACAHPHYGYTQGMSDLLAPVLAEIQHEADAFWCFEGLMQKTIFVSSPKDHDMDKQLYCLQDLLRLMHPRFYSHLKEIEDGLELLFCHRWILLCFKREFNDKEAFQMWEACWAHYQTDYFHLFLCLAIIIIYGEDVIEQKLRSDEMLLHFSSLAMHMSGKLVLRKARGLLHQFRLCATIPCTLQGLTSLCSHGMWDSGHVPKIQCTGHKNEGIPLGSCLYDVDPGTEH